MDARFREEVDQPKLNGQNRNSDIGAKVTDMRRLSSYFRASDFEGQAVPDRSWLVPGFIPADSPSLLGGDGGTGKSLLGLQLCAAVALDRAWLGMAVQPGRALFITAEDDRAEIHRRLAAIAASEGLGLGEMHQLTIRSLAGEDALLAELDRSTGQLVNTPLFAEIDRLMGDLNPVVVVFDTLADMFPGNENDRTQARQFVGMLRGLALRHRCAVVMLAHPSLTGLNSGSGSSGSTGWNNSVRSRLYLDRDRKGPDGEPEDPDVRVLSVKKSNYGSIGDKVQVRWSHGVFIADGEKRMDRLSKVVAQNQADEMFLALLDQVTAQGRTVSDATGRSYAPAVFAEQPDNGKITGDGFRQAMNRLFAANRIRVEMEGSPSRQRRRIVRSNEVEQ